MAAAKGKAKRGGAGAKAGAAGRGAKADKAPSGGRDWSPRALWRIARRWLLRAAAAWAAAVFALILLYKFVNPPTTPYIFAEWLRLGQIDRRWVPIREFSPEMARSVVASEDANFCRHWGFDLNAIRAAAEDGGRRGGSTIDQQVVKNVFLWQGHSWPRKALEALITPVAEIFWSKRRILELYLNLAETGPGTFGMAAAAEKAFHVAPDKITLREAALLATVLPDPQRRDAAKPRAFMRSRALAVEDGARTIAADGRAKCFLH